MHLLHNALIGGLVKKRGGLRMALLEDLRPGVLVKGLLPAGNVTVAITEMPLGIARLDELSQTITPTVGRCPTNVAQPQVDRQGQPGDVGWHGAGWHGAQAVK
jgi:hypothetical protein